MGKEIWKDVIGFEGIYSVSNKGRIRRDICSKGGVAGRILKPAFSNGYLAVCLCKNGTRKTTKIHRIMVMAFIGVKSKEVNHKDRVKINNNLKNLEYVTHRKNAQHHYKSLR